MRLIDADALMNAVMAQEVVDKSVAKRLILQVPTVEAVPRDWWEELRSALTELREINEYDTDSEIYQVAKVLLDSMNVFEGKGCESDE